MKFTSKDRVWKPEGMLARYKSFKLVSKSVKWVSKSVKWAGSSIFRFISVRCNHCHLGSQPSYIYGLRSHLVKDPCGGRIYLSFICVLVHYHSLTPTNIMSSQFFNFPGIVLNTSPMFVYSTTQSPTDNPPWNVSQCDNGVGSFPCTTTTSTGASLSFGPFNASPSESPVF